MQRSKAEGSNGLSAFFPKGREVADFFALGTFILIAVIAYTMLRLA